MRKLFLCIVFATSFSLQACHQITEKTETIPAQLEVTWNQAFNPAVSLEANSTLPTELQQQFHQFGKFKSSANIKLGARGDQVEFKVRFEKEITSSEATTIAPAIGKILVNRPYKLSFHGPIKKQITSESFGIFGLSSERSSTITQDSGSTTIEGNKAHEPIQ